MKYKQKHCLVGNILEVSHKGGAQPFCHPAFQSAGWSPGIVALGAILDCDYKGCVLRMLQWRIRRGLNL